MGTNKKSDWRSKWAFYTMPDIAPRISRTKLPAGADTTPRQYLLNCAAAHLPVKFFVSVDQCAAKWMTARSTGKTEPRAKVGGKTHDAAEGDPFASRATQPARFLV